MIIRLFGQVFTATYAPACFSFDPSLAITVLRIMDVFTCVQKSRTSKIPVNVTNLRGITTKIDYSEESLIFLNIVFYMPSSSFLEVIPFHEGIIIDNISKDFIHLSACHNSPPSCHILN